MSTYISKEKCDIKKDSKKEQDCAKCQPKHSLPKKILFECGIPGSSITFTSAGQSSVVSSTSIDTTCLRKPNIKVEFSSIVTFDAVIGSTPPLVTRLKFELVKICDNRQELICDTHMYERFFAETGNIGTPFILSDSFTFVFCECNAFPGCCEYFVRVTADAISIDTVTMQNNVTATVSNGRMGVFASEC
ncbi:DUF4489 domain-containing protein [Wukongibacter baidiensis]|uniref:DUF4489 domain-containing protein n=1 Tax=Wukongibacter baidiensis TaxID=1723361 RepID=UPI003D7F65AA